MKIALISPKGTYFSRNEDFQEFIRKSKNMSSWRQIFTGISPGLLVVAALTPKSYEIDFIDENYEQIDFSQNYDLVGITAMTQQATRAYKIAGEFRKRNIKVVIGGIHSTVLPNEAKQYADAIVIGEAEYIWGQLLDDIKKNKLRSFYKSEKVVDLEDSPLPRYDLVNQEFYKTIWIQASRGCPHDCEFCAATKIFGSKYRHKSIEQVAEEIEFIKNKHGNIHIAFSDDNLFVNRSYSEKLLKKIIPLNIRYHAQSDIAIAEKSDLLSLLRKSGCVFLLIGFESVNKKALKKIDRNEWKAKHFNKYPQYIEKIQSMGIGVQGAFMIGNDSDDKTIFKKTSDFVINNNLFEAQITISTPLPGTRLRSRLEKEGRLLDTKWENYTFGDVNYIPKNMSIEELQNGFIEIYRNIDNETGYLKKMVYFKGIQKKLIKMGLK